MERWHNRVAVVTGASSGIGEAIAHDLVKAGLRVVALARRLDRLEENRLELPKSLQLWYYPRQVDITNESEVQKTFTWIEDTLGGVDILVNNAGIFRFGNLIDMSTKTIDDVMNTNIKGVIFATQAAYKSMTARKVNGHIVHINSCLGHHIDFRGGIKSMNIYSPTKFALTAINETLRHELRSLGTEIKTTSISPGGVRTELLPSEAFEGIKILEPKDVSQAVLFVLSTPEHVQVHELTVKAVGEPT